MKPTEQLTSRERVDLALRHVEADRVPRAESIWRETLEQWREQGMPPGDNLHDRFKYDIDGAGWILHHAEPGRMDVVERTGDSEVRRDGNGALLRYWKDRTGTPEHIGYTIQTPDDWRTLKKTLLAHPPAARVKLDAARKTMQRSRKADRWFCWKGVEIFEIAKDVIGHEGLCIAMADDPDWVADIFETHTRVAIAALDYLESEGIQFDGAWIYGDVAYNHGPFFSPAMYRRLMMDFHREHFDWFKSRGVPVIYHTDGDFRPILEPLIEAGVDCFQPLEAKAGMDVRELKPKYGNRASWMGNIDATVLLTNDRARIESEVASKIPVAMKGGGYIYHTDHSVPPGVRYDTYQFLMELLEQYGTY